MLWLVENFSNILSWIGGIVSCASIITKLTPTPKDDSVLEVVVNVLDKISVTQTAKNAEILAKNS